ncbi:hypothetical protein LSCM1_05672 [Leishmania martiniquensis]|uniref:Tubulin tyrosine ligase n=1 Tax=Leishmania martiniquensis TaxID=1580590 RepID=A0A836HS69_9TRYP|nr:hypothetical protein LSCM1_05672 [Leishmania martiniquensis]
MGHAKIRRGDSKRRDSKLSESVGGTPTAGPPTTSGRATAPAGGVGGGARTTPAVLTPQVAISVASKKKPATRSLAAKALRASSARRRKGRSSVRGSAASAATLPSPPSLLVLGKAKKNMGPAEGSVGGEGQLPQPEVARASGVGTDEDPKEQPMQRQQLKQLMGVEDSGAMDLKPLRELPPEDSDGGSDDVVDAAFSATLVSEVGGSSDKRSASRRVAVPVTSLAGKRHTKVFMIPGAASGAGAAASGSNGLGNGRRTGVVIAGGNSSGGSHHYGDCALRYRTDLDKEVIHFMFERYQHEQAHPTSSAAWQPASSITSACTAEGASGRADDGLRMSRSGGAEMQAAAASAAAAASLMRARRVSVEEVCVPASSDGEDKNIGLGDWHFFWMHVGRVRHTVCSSTFRWQEHQIINHFPDHAELTRKDLMYKNIKRYLRENQADNYARLTLHTATDWVSASAGSCGLAYGGGVRGRPLGAKTFCLADSVPLTFNIPNDMSMFKEKFQKRRGAQWIVKPTSRSQGKGIFLIDDVRSLQRWIAEKKETESVSSSATAPANRAAWVAPAALQPQRPAIWSSVDAAGASANSGNGGSQGSPTAPGSSAATAGASSNAGAALGSYIVSRYISNPLLIGGKKFDLRLYVLVTSYKPLVAYLHEDGFARFCATRYAGSSLAQEDLGSHLTNVALQKGDEHYNSSHGGKWSFKNMFLYVQKGYGPYVAEGLVKNIQFLIYHSLKAVEPVMFNDKHSYELYGYDILIDDHINPHLIEVNASPSMSTTTVSDRLLKEQVLTDTMKIVFPPGYPASNKGLPYWGYRLRTDLTTQQQTGFRLLAF